MVHPEADSVLKRALAARAQLVEEEAPQRVLACADLAIDCHRAGVSPPVYAGYVLRDHLAARQRQNRYGQ